MNPHPHPDEPERPADPVREPNMRLVRPYALTGGRTRSGAADLPL